MSDDLRPRGDAGSSLVEVLVALAITTFLLLGLLTSAVFALGATVTARQEQQAADFTNQAIEEARSLDYAALTMLSSQVTGALGVVLVSGVPSYDAGNGLEPIDASPTGAVAPHDVTSATANGSYTTRRYVTVPVGTALDVAGQPAVRRFTVEVSWSSKGRPHVRRVSTLLTFSRRGLPLPSFTWAYSGPAPLSGTTPAWVKNPGNDVEYGLVLNNQGARDTWTVSASTAGWTWYVDTDRDGLWSEDVATEPALTALSTGVVEPGALPVSLVAFRSIGVAESGTSSTVFTARSVADPTVSKTVTTSLTVQSAVGPPPSASPTPTPTASASPAPCNAGSSTSVTNVGSPLTATTANSHTLTTLHLTRTGATGDTTSTATAPLSTSTAALEPRLCNWSTDLHTSQGGRYLAAAGDGAASAAARLLEWRFQPGNKTQDSYTGAPVLTFWAQCPSGTPTLTANLLSLSGTTYTARSSATVAAASCTGTTFTRYSVSFPSMAAFTIALTDSLVVRLTSPTALRIAYAATNVPATLTIGMK